MKRFVFSMCGLAAAVTSLVLPAVAQTGADATSYATRSNPEIVVLDARSAPRGIMYAHVHIPARPGPFTVVYPKWIPGEHGPTGPLNNLTAIRVSANGHALEWNRDKVDLYAFHVDVPASAEAIDVDFDVLLNSANETMATRNVAVVNWNRDLLYQAETNNRSEYVRGSVLLPPGWDYGCALPVARRSGNRVDFETVTLETFVDSPLDMGRFFKHLTVWSGSGTHQFVDMFADKPQDLEIPAKLLAAYKRMTPEAEALYSARHWNVYHSLLTLSDAIGFQGIEHHESSDDRAPDDYLINPEQQLTGGDLLTHEFSHSWNGKYRRPYDLQQPNFQIPEQTDLLWVYEGMNQYLGDLLSFRTGIRDPKTYPQYLAAIYASMDSEPGRKTEPLIDTTTAAPYLYTTSGAYPSIRRTAGDFYTEGELIWLDADTIIRERSGGRKSLDDFLHRFAGPPSTGPMVVTYTRDQVESMLGDVVPYNWHDFFTRYVYQVSIHPPTDMLARSGWRLTYTATPNVYVRQRGGHNLWYSLGINVGRDDTISDVREGSPAWNAGLAAGMKLVAVDSQAYASDALDYSMKRAQATHAPIAFLASNGGFFATYTVRYDGGQRFPHLVRLQGRTDMLAPIMAAHAR